MSIEHRSYPRIYTRTESTAGSEWIATEKIHGASFVVATDGAELRFGKRKAWLEPDDPFFGWQIVRSSIAEGVRRMFAELGDGSLVRVYGELFGGGYPHPDVPAVPGITPVQTGTWYSPALGFAVFDVLVEAGDNELFLGYDEVVRLASGAGLSTVPLLARGSRAEVFALEVRRLTEVPARLGLPPIAGNLAEGLVLKPAATMSPDERPSLKRKIAEFDEARFDEAVAFDPDAFLSLEQLLDLAAVCVNPARVASARSKVGHERREILDELVLDVMVDLESLFPRRFAALGEDEIDALHDRLRSLAGEILDREA